MKKITLLFAVLIFGYTKAQTPTIQWQKSFGGYQYDYAHSIQQTTDGGYILTGYSDSTNADITGNHGEDDFWVLKLDATGVIQWQKAIGGSRKDNAYSIQQTSDGGYIVAGGTTSNNGDVTLNQGGTDYLIVKLDENGLVEWQKTLGGSDVESASCIQQTTDGGYIVAGSTASINGDVTENHGKTDYWVVKLDIKGALQWQKTLGGTDYDYGKSIQQTTDGGYIVAGYSISTNGDITENHGKDDFWIVKLDATGILQWQKSLGGIAIENASCIKQTTDGGYIVVGNTDLTNSFTGNKGVYTDSWIIKMDATGIIQWQKVLGGSGYDWFSSVQQTTDGGYIVAGSSSSTNGDVIGNKGGNDVWVVKFDSLGTVKWQKSLGGRVFDDATSIQQTLDGGYIIAGSTWSGWAFSNEKGDVTENKGTSDYWVVKLTPEVLATEDFLIHNILIHPNPATSSIHIETGNNTNIDSVIITDLAGKIIIQETQNTKTIATENLAQGLYLLHAFSGEQKMVSKFVKQ